MQQNQNPICPEHKLPIINIEILNDDCNLLCSKCSNNQSYALNLDAALKQLSSIKPQKDNFLLSYQKYLEGKAQRVKIQFNQIIEQFWKSFIDTLSDIKNAIITEEKINYYTTQPLNLDDIKEFAKMWKSNFKMNQKQEYQKTKDKLKLNLDNISFKFKQLQKISRQIKEIFGHVEDSELLNPSDQSADEKISEFQFDFEPIKEFKIVDKLNFERQILNLTISADDQFVFASGYDLPLTAFQISEKKLVQKQQIFSTLTNISNLCFDKEQNQLVYLLDQTSIEFLQLNQQNEWILAKNQLTPSRVVKMVMSENTKFGLQSFKQVYMMQKNDQQLYEFYTLPTFDDNVINISINKKGNMLATCHKSQVNLWDINNVKQIKFTQKLDQYSIVYAQFCDIAFNLLCLISEYGGIHIMKPDSTGMYYEVQYIHRTKPTYGCCIRFCNEGRQLILGNHQIQIFKQDEENENEWTEEQLIKINCWLLEVTSDARAIVATDFKSLCLLSRD